MELEHPQSADATGQPPRRRHRAVRILFVSLAILAAAFFIAWNAIPPQVPDTPFKLTRGENGQFDAPAGAGLRFVAHAGKIDARNNLTSATVSHSGSHPRLACRSMLVVCQSDHLLAKRVAGELLDRLKQLDYVQTITYLPPGERLPDGALAPDVFFSLELVSLNETGLIDRVVDAVVLARAGTSPMADSHHYTNTLTPPVVEFDWNAMLEHHSTTREVASSAARYKLVANDIAEQISKALAKQLGEYRDKHGLLPELPDEFYPDYQPPPALPLDDLEPLTVFSGHGLLRRNETVWKCRTEKPLVEVLQQLRGPLESAGFSAGTDSRHDDSALRLTSSNGRLSVFAEDANGARFPALQREDTGETVFYVKYVQKRVAEDRDRAVAKLFELGVPLETLMLFEHGWTKEQRAAMIERFQTHPPSTAKTWLMLANLLHRNRQDDDARDALRRAVAMLTVEPQPGALKPSIKSLAKTLGNEELAKQAPDVELLRTLGFVELRPTGAIPDVRFGADGAANFFARNGQGELSFVSLPATREASDPAGALRLAVVRCSPHSRSWTSGQIVNERWPMKFTFPFKHLGQVAFVVSKEAGKSRFRATVEVRGNEPTEPSPSPQAGL